MEKFMKFKLDLTKVNNMFDTNRIPVAGNEDRIKRFAFDLFQVDGEGVEDLWQIQADDDGKEYLVRTYSLPEEEKVITSSWSVSSDKKCANLTIYYKDIPLKKMASESLGIQSSEIDNVKTALIKKLSNNSDFIIKFIATLPADKIEELQKTDLFEKLEKFLKSDEFTDVIKNVSESSYKLTNLQKLANLERKLKNK